MAHQGSKINDYNERIKMYKFLDKLEYDLLKLPKPDMVIFLYIPYEYAKELKKHRTELDQHEISKKHLKKTEKVYLELSNLRGYEIINCVKNNKIRTKEDIQEEIKEKLKK